MSSRRSDLFEPTDERFKRGERERGRFGDNETIRGNDSVRSNLVDLKAYFVRSTEKGIGIARSDRAGPTIWLPKSQIEIEPREPKGGALIEVTLPSWLAREKGLI